MLQIILGILCSLLALFFLFTGVMGLLGTLFQKKRCSARAEGTVTDITISEIRQKNHTLRTYTTHFTFTADGQVCTVKTPFPSDKKRYASGQAVRICYNPAKPDDFYIDGDPQNSPQGSFMLLCIGILAVMGAVTLFTL